MELEYVDVELLKEHPENPKRHTDQQLKNINNSISRFGWTQPIVVDENNTVLIGHGRWRAVSESKIPAYRIKGLTEAGKKALMVADNSVNLETGFEPKAMEQALLVLEQAGFPAADLGLIAEVLGETGKRAEDPNKLQESYKRYLEGETKRLVLYFLPKEFQQTEERIDRLMVEQEIPMRCDLVLGMILEYEREYGSL